MRYALISPLDNSVTQIEIAATQPPDAGRWKWLPITDDPVPFDPMTEISSGTTLTVYPTYVQETIIKRAMTAQELDQTKDDRIAKADLIALQIAFNHENRIRALASPPQNPITLAQFKAAIKGLI